MEQKPIRTIPVPPDHYPDNTCLPIEAAWTIWLYTDRQYRKAGMIVKLGATFWQVVKVDEATKRWSGKAKSRTRAIEAAIIAGVL